MATLCLLGCGILLPVPLRWDCLELGALGAGRARLTPRFCRGFMMPDEGQHQLPGPVAPSRSENLLSIF